MATIQRRPVNSLRSVLQRNSTRQIKTAARALAAVGPRTPQPSRDVPPTVPISTGHAHLNVPNIGRPVTDHSRLPDFTSSIVNSQSIGAPFAFSQRSPDPRRIFGVPRSVEKEFAFLNKPFSVVRQATLELCQLLEKSKGSGYDPRLVITGALGSGKSYLLLQAIEYCIASQWIVLSLPRAISFVDCTTPYNYDTRTQTFLQPLLSAHILRQLRDMEHPGLRELKTTLTFDLEKAPMGAPQAGSPLIQLIEYGVREVSVSPFVLEAVLAELASQTRYPFLMAIDGIQALYHQSLYKTPQSVPIESYHLSLPRLFLEYANGSRKINSGAFLGALSLSNTSFLPSTELYETLKLDLTHGKRPDAYTKRSAELQYYAQGLEAFKMPERLDIREAAGIFEIWMSHQALHSTPSDQLFLSKYCESDGNPREFVWRGLMNTLDS